MQIWLQGGRKSLGGIELHPCPLWVIKLANANQQVFNKDSKKNALNVLHVHAVS